MTIEIWYAHIQKFWVVQRLDEEGNQVGEADYVHYKKDAILYAKMHMEHEGIKAIKVFDKQDQLQKTIYKEDGEGDYNEESN